ncbi:MAG: aspartate kinase [Jaaginema sp. PMC 1079.18]|nr:aspartate kinase [Jaaginema sp. PMC 1080.18]MEC4852205.1 aspartate kinase [Jaaginema sp. PMC 1079.18]MEC4865324.1 aspartate kinase [Jaaginema sp. PMC 1078.18]
MALIVQKYGGTSVGSVERIQAVADRVRATVQAGNSVVVVVSAMGKTTDGLVKLAQEVSTNPSRREMDMLLSTGEQVSIALLSMALQELGQAAISLTGAQVGIVTESEYSRARILDVRTDRLTQHLDQGKVVVVAGFQGISQQDNSEITTLGRGGSDTSAVALAAALGAQECQIYTDVPGILTTDPRLVPEAQLMEEITCDEMLELASLGAKVLHPRAVEIARNYGVSLRVLSSWSDRPGTKVISPIPQPRSLHNLEITKAVDAVEFDTNQAKVALLRVPDRPGVAARLFGEISRQNVDVDLIIQSIHDGNTNDIAFTVETSRLSQAEAVAEAVGQALVREMTANRPPRRNQKESLAEVITEQATAKISIAGAGMIGRPGIAAQMFAALADAGVNIEMISTSEVKVSCTIDVHDCDRAISSLCRTFDIDASPIQLPNRDQTPQNAPPVRGVALDRDQARLSVRSVPDQPGMSAKIFGVLAKKNVSVDTIIQSQRCRILKGTPTRDLACTIAQADAEIARLALQDLASLWDWGEVTVDTNIAKVSIVGAGMVGHPGVAAQMFAALAQHQINIQMITTSEIKISCVVAEADGVKALKIIHDAFQLAGQERVELPA